MKNLSIIVIALLEFIVLLCVPIVVTIASMALITAISIALQKLHIRDTPINLGTTVYGFEFGFLLIVTALIEQRTAIVYKAIRKLLKLPAR